MTEVCVDLTEYEIAAAGVQLGTIRHMGLKSGVWEHLGTLVEKILLAAEATETANPDG